MCKRQVLQNLDSVTCCHQLARIFLFRRGFSTCSLDWHCRHEACEQSGEVVCAGEGALSHPSRASSESSQLLLSASQAGPCAPSTARMLSLPDLGGSGDVHRQQVLGMVGAGRASCCSCSLSKSDSVLALSYYTSDLFKPYTSNILPEAAPLCTQIRLSLWPAWCIAFSATPSEDSALPSLMPKQTLSPLTVSVLSATGFPSAVGISKICSNVLSGFLGLLCELGGTSVELYCQNQSPKASWNPLFLNCLSHT